VLAMEAELARLEEEEERKRVEEEKKRAEEERRKAEEEEKKRKEEEEFDQWAGELSRIKVMRSLEASAEMRRKDAEAREAQGSEYRKVGL
jgi:hypothetical protein